VRAAARHLSANRRAASSSLRERRSSGSVPRRFGSRRPDTGAACTEALWGSEPFETAMTGAGYRRSPVMGPFLSSLGRAVLCVTSSRREVVQMGRSRQPFARLR
jgi:hypothetical protein